MSLKCKKRGRNIVKKNGWGEGGSAKFFRHPLWDFQHLLKIFLPPPGKNGETAPEGCGTLYLVYVHVDWKHLFCYPSHVLQRPKTRVWKSCMYSQDLKQERWMKPIKGMYYQNLKWEKILKSCSAIQALYFKDRKRRVWLRFFKDRKQNNEKLFSV